MIITEMQDTDHLAWDAYVESSKEGVPQQLSGWRDVMSKTYGYETHFLMAREEGQVVGVLPQLIVCSFLVGSRAVTMPGGLCADNDHVARSLIDRAQEIAREARVKQLTLQDTRRAWPGNLHSTTEHVTWAVDVGIGAETLWNNLNRYTRRDIRRTLKRGLIAKVDRTGGHLDECHQVLSRFAHDAGTPFFSKDFLTNVVESFPGRSVIAMIYLEGKPIAAYFLLSMRNTIWGLWGGALHEHLEMGASYLAYWEILNDAVNHGYQTVDLGRSPTGSGASDFKAKWGGVSTPVYQQVATIGRGGPQKSLITQIRSGGKMKQFVRIWPRLPQPLVHYLGPRLRRHVPFA
jgi:FemAB-related protein (PEP-CTERM system-associated)